MAERDPMTGAQRVAKRRAALRAQGLRPRTFWLPDVRSSEFKEQARATCEWLWAHQERDADTLRAIEDQLGELLQDEEIPALREDK